MDAFYSVLKHVQMSKKTNLITKPANGSFSKIYLTKTNGTLVADEWDYCRERFQDTSKAVGKLLFYHNFGKSYNIACFINKIEKILKISDRSTFGPTQNKKVTWMRISLWWTTSSMRRSLFTILLRAGQYYVPEKGNFWEALFSIEYTKDTEFAIKWFLKGNTVYVGRCTGWYRQFKYGGGDFFAPMPITDAKVKKLLIKPKKL